jgi:hypothetical protein
MPQHDVVVIGGSVGGLQALSTILPALPASVLIVVHAAGNHESLLPDIRERVQRAAGGAKGIHAAARTTRNATKTDILHSATLPRRAAPGRMRKNVSR